MLTSAPRSAVVHVVGHPDNGSSFTRCGRRIGDNWAGEYTAEPEGPATCARCIAGEAADQAALERSATLKVGQRVGILTGVQSVNGPFIGSYGTVTAVRAYWNGRPSYHVRADGESENYVYEAWQLADAGRKVDPAVIESVPTTVRGYRIRRATLIGRDLFGIMGYNADKGEYVIASMRAGESEWSAGFYTRNMVTADYNFRARFGA